MTPEERSALWILLCLAACGPEPTSTPSPSTGGGGSAGSESGLLLEFSGADPMKFAPGEHAELAVRLSPPRVAAVRFSLQGDASGASLSTGEQLTNEEGRATVVLRTPRTEASFRVRASIDGETTIERTIAIQEEGVASVKLDVLYHGVRATSEWEASLLAEGDPCAVDAVGTSPKSGSLPLLYTGLPANRPLRVRLRAGLLVFGCATLAPLRVEEQKPVELLVKNAPISSLNSMDLLMETIPEPSSWTDLLQIWSKRALDAYKGGNSEDPEAASALLDTMLVLASSQQRPALLLSREQHGWDELLTQRFAKLGGPGVAKTWLLQAQEDLKKSPGGLEGHVESKSGSSPVFEPSRMLRVGPQDILSSKSLSWKIDAGDTLLSSGELRFRPSVLLRRVIEQQFSEGPSPQQRLRTATDCEALGEQLASVTPTLETCNAPCLAALCNAALETMWQRAISTDELTNTAATLAFTASGAAELSESASVRGFHGSWVGQLKDSQAAGTVVAFQGTAAGKPTP